MSNALSWMRGNFNPTQIEICFLKSELAKARQIGDQIRENQILSNLQSLSYKATG